MAEHNFQIFDESMESIDTDAEYFAEGQRRNGVTPGLASPKMHNKLYRQCSVMAYAIASVLAARGFDANDADPDALANAIQRAFAFSVNGNVPNASGAVTAVRPIDAWPVGSLFMTFQNVNPRTLLGGGTWVQIKGKYLLAADTGNTVDGTSGVGAHTKNVPLVAHTHSVSTSSNGAHTHSVSGTTGGAGGHSHTRGTMNITGKIDASGRDMGNESFGETYPTVSGAFTAIYGTQYATTDASSQGRMMRGFLFDASDSWTGSTSTAANHTHSFGATTNSNGAHTHSGTTGSSGTSASFDVRPASVYVYMWRRTE